ncbi:putative Ig domain-containing protein [Dactylosporangium roseum]|uniref:Ig domain-containing protein n=1 Tax=Dactylosporangium roseum TaxID=47989 RepID=A0ABY5Z1C8_9ACTN|nr:putative Ig domain-containing protein [Dactylosporangium roseum]UWZ35464.1 putative Ig domain-containing protein [Dactylosporangium roseum]
MTPRPKDDTGFSLVETLASIAIIGVVMTALTTFFVSTTNTLNKERGLQMAVRLAHDGVELVKSLPGATVVAGRSRKDVANQLKNDTIPSLDLAALNATMRPAYDTTLAATASSVNPVLPIVPERMKVNDTSFERHWLVGACTMPLGGGDCGVAAIADPLRYYRVVVAVTWQNTRACAGGRCSYVTQTLVSASSTDPVFNPSVTVAPPLPDNPGNQASDVGVAIDPVKLSATTSYPPITWTADNLPPGLSMSDAGLISGTPKIPGVYVVRVNVQDASSANDASFNWVVNALPTLAPPDQTWDAGSAVSYQVPVVGGTAPFTWTAKGLPDGLSIDPVTGVVTGSSKVSGPAAVATVDVTVTDKYQRSAKASFKWNVKAAVLSPNRSVPIALNQGEAYSGSVVGGGGSGSYTWSATNLPDGLTISGAGLVTGTVNGSTRYLVTIGIRDSLGATNSMLVPVDVTVKGTGLRVTAPSTASADRTNAKGTAITTVTAQAGGGAGTYRWTQTGLPPGVSLNATTGAMTGTPTTAGTYIVTLVVTDKAKTSSIFMFVWTIT